jgi:hypothetical protein
MSWNCAGSEYLVGGGCNCTTPGVVIASYPDYAYQTWRCACTSGLGDTSAMCLPKTALSSRRVVVNGPCAADEQLIGGGCDCGASFHMTESVPDVAGKGWICTCAGAATPGKYAICAK